MVTARRTASNENIQTYGDGTRDFTSLSTWEAATDIDLVGGAQSEVLECFDDAASFDDQVVLASATTNSSFFRIIRSASGEGHDGTSNNGVFFDNTAASIVFNVSESFFQIQDLIVSSNINSAMNRAVFQVNSASSMLIGCIAFDSVNSGTGAMRGLRMLGASDGSGCVLCLFNNIDEDGVEVSNNAENNFIYNTNAIDCGTGFDINDTSCVLKNCLADGNTTADFEGTVGAASITNASSDATAPGTSPRTSQTFTYVNAAGDDYHLDAADAGADNFGTDLSADGVFAFDDDIDFETFNTWDIGFDENDASAVGHANRLINSRTRLTTKVGGILVG